MAGRKGRRGARSAGYDESKPWGEIAEARRNGWTFKELSKKYQIPQSTLSRVLSEKIGAFPGDECASPLEAQAKLDDKRTPSEIAYDAMLSGLRKIERQIKSRRPTAARDVEILLGIWQKLALVEGEESMESEVESRIDTLRAERRSIAASLDELYTADEKLRATMGASDKEKIENSLEQPDDDERG